MGFKIVSLFLVELPPIASFARMRNAHRFRGHTRSRVCTCARNAEIVADDLHFMNVPELKPQFRFWSTGEFSQCVPVTLNRSSGSVPWPVIPGIPLRLPLRQSGSSRDWLPLNRNSHYGYFANNPEFHLYGKPEYPSHAALIAARDHIREASEFNGDLDTVWKPRARVTTGERHRIF